MIVVVDYGVGNLRSIVNKLNRLGIEATASGDFGEIACAEKLILPGVGHFAAGMRNLKASGLVPALTTKVLQEGTPILGICLGMQLFAKWSDEGQVEGLGWMDAAVRRINGNGFQPALRVPHVGWNTIDVRHPSPLLDGMPEASRFYFTHSYFMDCEAPEDVLATTDYGTPFTSIVQNGNLFGTQFHPEKSHRYGMRVLENFARLGDQ
jgi:glutamine amidotransferase